MDDGAAGRHESGGLHKPDPPAQQWWLYRAFDGGNGSGGAIAAAAVVKAGTGTWQETVKV